MVSKSKSETVIPGSFLTTEEEFLPGKNTFEDSSGNIYSTTTGSAVYDSSKKEVTVDSKPQPAKAVDAGSIIIAKATVVREQVAFLEISSAENHNQPRKVINSFASLHVSAVSDEYVDSMKSVLRIGDLVKARVAEVTPYSISVTLKGPDFGVIKAFCVRCRRPLSMFDRTLKCLSCGNSEDRKISKDYILK